MDSLPPNKTLTQLDAQWEVAERPFTSEHPTLGDWIVKFRTWWNRIATVWYVRPILQQQNEVNHLIVTQLHEHEKIWVDQAETYLRQDEAHVALQRQVAALTTAVVDLQKRVIELEAKAKR